MSTASKAGPWIRGLVDYGAGVAFLVAFFMTRDVMTATKALMIGAAIALAVGLIVERRLAWLPLLTGAAAMVFGGLTLLFHDERIIKMKPTILNLAFAAALIGGVAIKRNPLKALLGSSLTMPEAAWRTLAIRYGLFFVLIAIANEVVWRTQPTEVWALFRFPGLLIATFAFALTQAPLMMRYGKAEDLPSPPPAD